MSLSRLKKNEEPLISDTIKRDWFTFLPMEEKPLKQTRLEAIGIIILLGTILALSLIGLVTVYNWIF